MNPYHQGQLDFFCAVYAFINAARLLFGIQLGQARDILATALHEISAQPVLWNALLRNQTDHHWVISYMLGRFANAGSLPMRAGKLPEKPLPRLREARSQEIHDWLELSPPKAVNLAALGPEHMFTPGVEFGYHMPWVDPEKRSKRQWQQEDLWWLCQNWLPSRNFLDILGPQKKQDRCIILRFHRFLPPHPAPLICHWSTGHNFTKDNLNLFDCTANKEGTHILPLNESTIYPELLGGKRLLAIELESIYFIEKI